VVPVRPVPVFAEILSTPCSRIGSNNVLVYSLIIDGCFMEEFIFCTEMCIVTINLGAYDAFS